MKMIRVIFPLLKRKDGKPRKRQEPVICSLNGATTTLPRGKILSVPEWVQEACAHSSFDEHECFVSNQEAEMIEKIIERTKDCLFGWVKDYLANELLALKAEFKEETEQRRRASARAHAVAANYDNTLHNITDTRLKLEKLAELLGIVIVSDNTHEPTQAIAFIIKDNEKFADGAEKITAAVCIEKILASQNKAIKEQSRLFEQYINSRIQKGGA